MLGETVGHYKILELLGAGGMGEVYRAEDTTLDREVALKVLPPDLSSDPDRLARFEREAKTLAALDHPNIVTIHTVEVANGVRFLTMQLVEGQPLSEMIPKGGMSLDRIFDIAIPLADALATAHQTGVIHRDLKPANIMVTDDGRVKVLDFGLAKLRQQPGARLASELPTEPLTEEGKIVGTMPYMSPEQLEGKEIDARSDIFSLGVLLYEMATGERPFKGDSSASLITAIMSHSPREVDSLRAELPHHLSRIIRHCLEKEPAKRYQSALDVRNELQDLHREVSVSAAVPVAPEPKPEPTPKPVRWPMVAVAGAAIVIAVLLALWLGRSKPSAESPTEALAESAAVEAQPPMIVVLPFENLGDPDDEYFADGMTEEITSRLAVVRGLRVISRTSAMQYKDDRPSLKQVGEELGVDYVLEGTVRWAKTEDGSRVRITPQLIQVSDDFHLWADSYDRVINDIFEVQSDIAGEVIHALGVTLRGEEQAALAVRPTESIEAYHAYLRGIDLYSKARYEDSTRMLDKAVELDSTYAQAWARLCRGKLHSYFQSWSGAESLAEAQYALERAQALGPEDVQVRLAQAYYFYYGLRDFGRAVEEFEAIGRDFPNNPEIFEGMGLNLRRLGRWQESTAVFLDSLALDPQNALVLANIAFNYGSQRQFDEAVSYLNRGISLEPDVAALYGEKTVVLLGQGSIEGAREVLASAPVTEPMHRAWMEVHYYDRQWDEYLKRAQSLPREEPVDRAVSDFHQGLALLQLGRSEEARAVLQGASELLEKHLGEGFQWRLAKLLAHTYSLLGFKEEAIAQLERVSEILSGDQLFAPRVNWDLVLVYANAGEVDPAIELLDRLLATAYYDPITVHHLRLDPFLDPIRDHPRFQALLEKYGDETG